MVTEPVRPLRRNEIRQQNETLILQAAEKVFAEAGCERGKPAAVYAKVSNGRGLSFAGEDAAKTKIIMSMEAMDRALEELEGKTNG